MCPPETSRQTSGNAGGDGGSSPGYKIALADGGHATFEDALRWEALAQPVTLATADLQEGLRARAEKRPPVFTGR